MPMNFPDMDSLIRMGEMLKFRKPNEGESESDYRIALADFDKDPIESQEIRSGNGWDKWNEADKFGMLLDALSGKR